MAGIKYKFILVQNYSVCVCIYSSNFAAPLPPDLHPYPATDFAVAFGHR